MKKRISHSYNEEINSNNKNILLNPNMILENSSSKKIRREQNLFNHKSSLSVLFNLVKTFQVDYFSNQTKNKKIKDIKKVISSLQNNLSLMLTEKQKQFDYLKTKKENNKKKMQEILFNENHNKKVNTKMQKNVILNFHFLNEKKELNLINFQLDNDIRKTNDLIEQKYQIYFYTKSLPFYLDMNQEIFCNTNYESLEIISEILSNIKKSVKENFISVVKEKMKSELEINTLTFQINSVKENQINDKLNTDKKYIDSEEIIYEDTKENNKTLIANQGKRNSNLILNKLSMNKRASNILLKKIRKKKFSLDSLLKDNIIINDIQNKINNYLNMNINVNINLNEKSFKKKNSSSSSSSSSSSEEKEDDNKNKSKNDEIDIDKDNDININE